MKKQQPNTTFKLKGMTATMLGLSVVMATSSFASAQSPGVATVIGSNVTNYVRAADIQTAPAIMTINAGGIGVINMPEGMDEWTYTTNTTNLSVKKNGNAMQITGMSKAGNYPFIISTPDRTLLFEIRISTKSGPILTNLIVMDGEEQPPTAAPMPTGQIRAVPAVPSAAPSRVVALPRTFVNAAPALPRATATSARPLAAPTITARPTAPVQPVKVAVAITPPKPQVTVQATAVQASRPAPMAPVPTVLVAAPQPQTAPTPSTPGVIVSTASPGAYSAPARAALPTHSPGNGPAMQRLRSLIQAREHAETARIIPASPAPVTASPAPAAVTVSAPRPALVPEQASQRGSPSGSAAETAPEGFNLQKIVLNNVGSEASLKTTVEFKALTNGVITRLFYRVTNLGNATASFDEQQISVSVDGNPVQILAGRGVTEVEPGGVMTGHVDITSPLSGALNASLTTQNVVSGTQNSVNALVPLEEVTY